MTNTTSCRVYLEPCSICGTITTWRRKSAKPRVCKRPTCRRAANAARMRALYAENPERYKQRQKDIRHDNATPCVECGDPTSGERCATCQRRRASEVAVSRRPPAKTKPPKRTRTPKQQRDKKKPTPSLRDAYEANDAPLFFDILQQLCSLEAETGCWTWAGQSRGGYACLKWSRKNHRVHRLSARMSYGTIRGPVVHHVCANTLCVNPDHLQPVSHRENVAEMLQRHYYLDRIAELENALAEYAPKHPLLDSGAPPLLAVS